MISLRNSNSISNSEINQINWFCIDISNNWCNFNILKWWWMDVYIKWMLMSKWTYGRIKECHKNFIVASKCRKNYPIIRCHIFSIQLQSVWSWFYNSWRYGNGEWVVSLLTIKSFSINHTYHWIIDCWTILSFPYTSIISVIGECYL